jgi:hypothetical protein
MLRAMVRARVRARVMARVTNRVRARVRVGVTWDGAPGPRASPATVGIRRSQE